jgi:CRISPR-associated protein Cas2
MIVVVAYDVSTVEAAGRRRLARVARACKDYGVRVQKSVFECQVGQADWARLRDRLLSEYKSDEDSLRFYFLDEAAAERTEHYGVAKPVNLTEPLIL